MSRMDGLLFMNIEIEGGKYRIRQCPDGSVLVERNGAAWRDVTGDKLVYALAAEVERLREEVDAAFQRGVHAGQESL